MTGMSWLDSLRDRKVQEEDEKKGYVRNEPTKKDAMAWTLHEKTV